MTICDFTEYLTTTFQLQKLKQNDAQISQQHFDTWTSLWGRPGHGAPGVTKNKLNLDELLYRTPLH